MTHKIFDILTKETTEVPLTVEEIAEREKWANESILEMELEEKKATEKNLLLAKLGITEDEAKLLLS